MIDRDDASEFVAANQALRPRLARLTNAEELFPFVVDALTESAQAVAAASAAIFLFDDQSNQLRAAIVLEDGRTIDFFKEERFVELREPFELGHSSPWQELVITSDYQWRDLTDEAKLPFKWLIPWYRRTGLKGGLTLPLIFNARPIGLAVYVCRRSEPPAYSRLELVKNLICEAAVAIQLLKISHRVQDVERVHEEMRAAGEVHESVAQSLTAISMHLAGAHSCLKSDPAKAARGIDKARELAKLGIQLVRRTTLVLRPSQSQAMPPSQTLVDFMRDAVRERGLISDFREIGQIP
jgi:signal transduction histidine kinase